MGLFKKIAAGTIEKITNSPVGGSKQFLVVQKYVNYILDNRLNQTAVTLIQDKVPGTNYKIYKHDFLVMFSELDKMIKELSPELIEISKRINKKIKAEIEPEIDEWEFIKDILIKFEKYVDYSD